MKPEHPLLIGNENLCLLAGKAIYWLEQEALLIADAHFGKAAAYRALGQPVPQGTTTQNLQRLDALIERYQPKQLIFLGDFLHAPKSHSPATLTALRAWREKHTAIQFLLVRGNHDLRAGDPPADLRITMVDEPYLVGGFALQHHPKPHATHHVVAGHLHPVFRLQGKGKQSLQLPCFLHDDGVTLLPSFGDFTGGYAIQPQTHQQVFVTDGSCVWPVKL